MSLAVTESPKQPELTQTLGDITECNNEQLHLFSSVQAHGCFLGFTWPDQRVQCASENVSDFFLEKHPHVLGARLEHLLEKEVVAKIGSLLREFSGQRNQGRYISFSRGDVKMEAYLYESQGLYCLEIEKKVATESNSSDGLDLEQMVGDYMRRAREAMTMAELGKLAAEAVRKVTGIDRVMIYKFLAPTWHGQVIAEDRVAKAHSFLGHRFPSSDIPRPARDLYLRNSFRSIPNVRAEVSKITPSTNPLTRKTVDLSDSRLRAVSLIHLEYLRNMGVGASFSLALNVKDQLWGLIACHHLDEFHISRQRWVYCDMIANAFSSRASMLETIEENERRLEFDKRLRSFFISLRSSADPIGDFLRRHREVEEIFEVSGIALVTRDKIDFAGLTPASADLKEIANWFRGEMLKANKACLAFQDLKATGALWERIKPFACGAVAVQLPGADENLFMLFRPEIIRTITWGGDPRKQLERKGFQGRVNPRESFAAWEEVISDETKPWEKHILEGAHFLGELVFDVLAKPQKLIEELRVALKGNV